PHSDPLAKHGIILDGLMSLTDEDTSTGGLISIRDMQSFLSILGDLNDMEIWYSKLQIDLFKFILLHKGTDEVKGLGGLELMSPDQTAKKFMSWTEFQSHARAYFDTHGVQFTFRRCARSFGDLYWTFWEKGVPGIAEIKENGTVHSRQYRLENGTNPAAWVLVPDLFGDHLTKEEAEIRVADSKKADLNKSKAEEITYTGLDQDDTIDSHFNNRVAQMAYRRNLSAAEPRRRHRINRLGVGHHLRPQQDGWTAYLSTLTSPYDG
ncbi:hypothetical protein C8A03DRAFT_39483, partial [Achaetomium macrosporum]